MLRSHEPISSSLVCLGRAYIARVCVADPVAQDEPVDQHIGRHVEKMHVEDVSS